MTQYDVYGNGIWLASFRLKREAKIYKAQLKELQVYTYIDIEKSRKD